LLTLEETIELILKHRSDFERNDILTMIQEKRQELGPEVINDESAAMIVARELGVDLHKVTPSARQRIEDITESTKNVNALVGIIDNISSVRTFQKQDGTEGKVANVFLRDETGSIRVVLWDDTTRAISEDFLTIGSIVQVRGAYVKMGLGDTIELHIGRMGTIQPLESDAIDELGLDFDEQPASKEMKISSLQDRLFDVAMKVKIQRVFNLSTFAKKRDNSEGKVLSMIVSDDTGTARLVFWDDRAEEMEDAQPNEIIRVTGAYTKTNRDGNEIEIHAGNTAKVERKLKDKMKTVDAPIVSSGSSVPLGMKNIGDLTTDMWDVDIEGKVATIYDVKTFTKKDGSEGQVRNIIIADQTSKIRVTFWDDDVDKIAKVKEGDVIRILHGYTKEGFRGGLEFTVGKRAEIVLNPKGSQLKQLDLSDVSFGSIQASTSDSTPLGMKNIGDLTTDMWDVDIEGKVATIYDVKTFTKKDGSEGQVRNIIIADQTSKIRVTFWDDDVDKIAKVKEGDVIRILHGYTKEGFRGGLEFTVGKRAEIVLNPKGSQLKQLDLSDVSFGSVPIQASRVLIGDIDEGTEGKNVEVCGIIVGIAQTGVIYQACPTCNKKLEATGEGYNCKSCGPVKDPEPRMLYKITVDDGSGSIKATLFGNVGEKLLEMTAEEAHKMITKSGKEDEPLRVKSDKILGRYVAMYGRVKKFRDSLDISVNGFEFADPIQEIKRLKETIQKEVS
jgi:replication factor A1